MSTQRSLPDERAVREHTGMFVKAMGTKANSGLLHIPADGDTVEPLCGTPLTADRSDWHEKSTAVYPPGWGNLCGKCRECLADELEGER